MRKDNNKMYERIGVIIPNFEERAYITDIAKCLSSKKEVSRKNCASLFKEELNLFVEINTEPLIILQGYTNQSIFEQLGLFNSRADADFKPLIREGFMTLDDAMYKTIVVPHTARQSTTNTKWKEIIEKKDEIQTYLTQKYELL